MWPCLYHADPVCWPSIGARSKTWTFFLFSHGVSETRFAAIARLVTGFPHCTRKEILYLRTCTGRNIFKAQENAYTKKKKTFRLLYYQRLTHRLPKETNLLPLSPSPSEFLAALWTRWLSPFHFLCLCPSINTSTVKGMPASQCFSPPFKPIRHVLHTDGALLRLFGPLRREPHFGPGFPVQLKRGCHRITPRAAPLRRDFDGWTVATDPAERPPRVHQSESQGTYRALTEATDDLFGIMWMFVRDVAQGDGYATEEGEAVFVVTDTLGV